MARPAPNIEEWTVGDVGRSNPWSGAKMRRLVPLLLALLPTLAPALSIGPTNEHGVFRVGQSVTITPITAQVFNVYWQRIHDYSSAGHYFAVDGGATQQFVRLPATYAVTRLGSNANRSCDPQQHDIMARWGATVRRDRLDWKTIEVSPGVFSGWTSNYYGSLSHDDVVSYRTNEFTGIWQLYGAANHCPLYLYSNSTWRVTEGGFLTAVSNYYYHVFSRYGGRGLAWEPFNEPDTAKMPNTTANTDWLAIQMHRAARAAATAAGYPNEKIYGPADGTSAAGGRMSTIYVGITNVVSGITWHDGVSFRWDVGSRVDFSTNLWHTVPVRLAAHTAVVGTNFDFIIDEYALGGLSAVGRQLSTNGTFNVDWSNQPWDSAWHDAAKSVIMWRAYGTNVYFHYYGLGHTGDNQLDSHDGDSGPHPRASAFMQTLYLLENARYVSCDVLGGVATNGWRYTFRHPTRGTIHFAWTTLTNSLPVTALTNGVRDILTFQQRNIWEGETQHPGVLTHEPSLFTRPGGQ